MADQTGPSFDMGDAMRGHTIMAQDPALAQLLSAGQPLELGGNQPFSVSGDHVWFVVEGAVDLFLLGGGGRRHHVLRVSPGQALFGLSDEVIGVPINGSRLVRLAGSTVRDQRVLTSRWISGWLAALTLATAPPPPRQAIALPEQTSHENGFALATADCWLGGDLQTARLFGAAPIEGPAFPLPAGGWISVDQPATASPAAEWIERPDWAEGVSRFQQAVLYCLAAQASEWEKTEASRIQGSEHNRVEVERSAIRQLVRLFGRQPHPPMADRGTPLASAAGRVAAAMGIELEIVGGSESGDDPLNRLLHNSGVSSRPVRLEGRWWQRDIGPLLAFLGDWSRPCALLPVGSGGYLIFDAAKQSEQRLDAALASQLSPRAFMLYRGLPDERVGAPTLMQLALRGASRDFGLIAAMALLTALLSLLLPLLSQQLVATVIPEAQFDQLVMLVAALLVGAGASAAFAMVQSIALLRVEGRSNAVLQPAIWDRLLKVPVSFFRSFSVGDLTARAQAIDAVQTLIGTNSMKLVLAVASGTASLGLMLYYDAALTGVTAVLLGIWLGANLLLGNRMAEVARERLLAQRRDDAQSFQLLSGISKLRAAGSEHQGLRIWTSQFLRVASLLDDTNRNASSLATIGSVLSGLSFAGVIAVLGLQSGQITAFFETPMTWRDIESASLRQIMTAAEFVGFNTALMQVLAAVQAIGALAASLFTLRPVYAQLRPILEAAPETTGVGAAEFHDLSGRIEVADIRFRYQPEAPFVLDGLSLTVEPGQFVAVVGPSGCGKSTLVRLLLGFEEPQSGSVFLDGRDLRRLDKRRMRRNFGVVLQAGRLLTGSLYDNIVAGANLTMEDAWEAARLAGLATDIEAMPMGMHTVVGEGAPTLSGGQRQRLMIARALVHRPRILIFDEATSALDNRTQATVNQSLTGLTCTRIAIAHRLSTIREADCIYVIDRGRVVEKGAFLELMHAGGKFSELAHRQLAPGAPV